LGLTPGDQLPNQAAVSEVFDIGDEVGKAKRAVFATETCFRKVNIAHWYTVEALWRGWSMGKQQQQQQQALGRKVDFAVPQTWYGKA
jgi:hypothetical protein